VSNSRWCFDRCARKSTLVALVGRVQPADTETAPSLLWFAAIRAIDCKKDLCDLAPDIRGASILKDGRAVFNIAGNKYRIVVWINYPYRGVYVRFIGTHWQYNRIDAQTV
jgi:mRNA interferase HigB